MQQARRSLSCAGCQAPAPAGTQQTARRRTRPPAASPPHPRTPQHRARAAPGPENAYRNAHRQGYQPVPPAARDMQFTPPVITQHRYVLLRTSTDRYASRPHPQTRATAPRTTGTRVPKTVRKPDERQALSNRRHPPTASGTRPQHPPERGVPPTTTAPAQTADAAYRRRSPQATSTCNTASSRPPPPGCPHHHRSTGPTHPCGHLPTSTGAQRRPGPASGRKGTIPAGAGHSS